jgi:hypothetical protein
MKDRRVHSDANENVLQLAKRLVDSTLSLPVDARVQALDQEIIGRIARHFGADVGALTLFITEYAVSMDANNDRSDWPKDYNSEGRCARCGGVGEFGVMQVSRHASVQWEDRPHECLDPDGCSWPYENLSDLES